MLQPGCLNAKRFGRKKLVILAKSGGVEDIEAAYFSNRPSYAVVILPRSIVKLSGSFYLNGSVSDTDYHLECASLEDAKEKYRAHLIEVLDWFDFFFGLSAMVQFNVTYWAERELAAACTDTGIEFLAALKECMWSAGDIAPKIAFYRSNVGSFKGSAILVYNAVLRDILMDAGVVEKDRIDVVGCARVDQMHRVRQQSSVTPNKIVLFYLIADKAGLTWFKANSNEEWVKGAPFSGWVFGHWRDMAAKVNRAVVELALRHPDVRFICKGKTGFFEQQLQLLKDSCGRKSLPKNIELVAGGVGHHFLREACVAIGFNSTAVVEAIAAGVPVVVPNIFSEREKHIAKYAHAVNEGALVAETAEDLKSMVSEILQTRHRYEELSPAQANVLGKLLGNSDGRSGERLRLLLDNAVQNPRVDV